jgi:hypothetical protein
MRRDLERREFQIRQSHRTASTSLRGVFVIRSGITDGAKPPVFLFSTVCGVHVFCATATPADVNEL